VRVISGGRRLGGGVPRKRRRDMRKHEDRRARRVIGRVTTDTRGAPGIFMEGTGLWNGHGLTD
jgi:hypothetical protein